MSPDFEVLMKHLRERTADVELDLPSDPQSVDMTTASRLARSHRAMINHGDRVARAFKLVDGRRVSTSGSQTMPEIETLVTDTESRKLVAAGGKWIGSAADAPTLRQYIEQLRVRNYRCIKDVTIPLTPLHAFVGPNDAGKSTLLGVIGTLRGGIFGPDVEVTVRCQDVAFKQSWNNGTMSVAYYRTDNSLEQLSRVEDPEAARIMALQRAIFPIRLLRLDPDAMREPTKLIQQGASIEYDDRGRRLAGVYDALLSRQLDAFLAISQAFKTLFPTASAIQLSNPTEQTKALGVKLVDGSSVMAQQMSEGMLYWLAFAALPYLSPASVILIEEPENGLHPSRIAEVMRVLREMSKQSQIIVATHSPLVINELQADEVTLITRTPERGTIATPLSETKNFEQRSKAYALGELWLNYADGNFESELVSEPSK